MPAHFIITSIHENIETLSDAESRKEFISGIRLSIEDNLEKLRPVKRAIILVLTLKLCSLGFGYLMPFLLKNDC